MEDEDFLKGNIFARVTKGQRSNLFTPLIIFNAVTDPTLLFTAFRLDGSIWRHILFGLVLFIVMGSFFVYLYLLIKDRKGLMSEDYQIAEKQLDIMASKGREIKYSRGSIIEPLSPLLPPENLNDTPENLKDTNE